MADDRVCRACEYFYKPLNADVPVCRRTNSGYSKVTGLLRYTHRDPYSERGEHTWPRTLLDLFHRDDRCGPEGRYFELRTPAASATPPPAKNS